ncbi:MAG: TetR/AcrR family transcriptional regulator [Actinomycetota bacterium]
MHAARHRTPSNDIASAILDAAASLLTEGGPSALTVRRISEVASVAPMSVYNHFGDKAGVIDHLYQRGFLKLGRAFESSASLENSWDALRSSWRSYGGFALENEAELSIMFQQAIVGFTPTEPTRTAAAEAFDSFVQVIRRCMEDGSLDGDDPVERAQQIWAAIHGYVLLERNGWGLVGADQGAEGFERYLDLLGLGLTPRSSLLE